MTYAEAAFFIDSINSDLKIVTFESASMPSLTLFPSILTTVNSISSPFLVFNRIFSSLFLESTSILPPFVVPRYKSRYSTNFIFSTNCPCKPIFCGIYLNCSMVLVVMQSAPNPVKWTAFGDLL